MDLLDHMALQDPLELVENKEHKVMQERLETKDLKDQMDLGEIKVSEVQSERLDL